MKLRRKEKGFTLIELLLVVVIIGLMLAVIVPRAWRANIDTKYGLVRQAGTELASWGQEWTEQMIEAAPDTGAGRAVYYYASLSGTDPGALPDAGGDQAWVANPSFNWVGTWAPGTRTAAPVEITDRVRFGINSAPEAPVIAIVPPEKHPRNPFNGASYFTLANLPPASGITPGAIACCSIADGGGGATGYRYFAFLFQGTDSTTITLGDATTYHAGQDPTGLAGLRNGVFFARTR